MKFWRIIAFTMMSMLAGISVAQERVGVSDRIEVTLVEVPVTVTDRAGNPIRGLTAENFEILDDGARQVVRHFEAVDMSTITGETAAEVSPVVRRNFLLLFDLSYSSPLTIVRAQEAALDFVRDSIGPLDLAAVGTFSVERGFRLLSAFTSNPETLESAIRTLGVPRFFRVEDPLMFSLQTASGLAVAQAPFEGDTGQSDLAGIAHAALEHQQDLARGADRGRDDFQRARIQRTVANFGSIAEVLDSIRGRKQVILLSEGFDPRLVQGRFGDDAESEEQRLARLRGEVWKVDSEQDFGSATHLNALEQMGEIFKRNDTVLHAIDIRGLRGETGAREGRRGSSSDGLFLMANPTGGSVFRNRNELQGNFRKLLEQQEIVYVLGFTPTRAGEPGKVHRLQVKLKDVPGGRVSHRAGYQEPQPASNDLERTLESMDLLLSGRPRLSIGIDLLAVPFPVGNKVEVPVVMRISGPEILAAAGGSAVETDLFVYAFDENLRVVDFSHQRLSLDLERTRQTLEATGIRYYGTLELEPGTYDIRVLLRVEGSDRAGVATARMSIPELGEPMVLPPLFVGDADDWIMVRGEAGSMYPFAIGSEGFVPGVNPRLERDESQQVALFFYNVEPEDLALSAAVKTSEGATLPAAVALRGRTPLDEQGGMKLVFDFDPSKLPSGSHTLEFSVRPRGVAEQKVRAPFVLQ
ncbi:MAG: VWA domain-containing protein [Acidobacteria bacterium]|nr:VWA domain-containing protein [Acidobacteriota bacterium]